METFEGDTIQRPIGELELEIEGQRATVPVVFAEEGEPEAIGRTTLAVMLLEPNLEKGRLELFPYLKGTDAPLDWGKMPGFSLPPERNSIRSFLKRISW